MTDRVIVCFIPKHLEEHGRSEGVTAERDLLCDEYRAGICVSAGGDSPNHTHSTTWRETLTLEPP